MLTVGAFVLSFVASTLAYTVIFPNGNSGWSDEGPQFVNWTRVNTDPANVTIVITNQHIENFQPSQLVALAPGGDSSGFAIVNPPSGNWVDGLGFRINLVDVNNSNSILAQSNEFSINSSSSTNSSTTTTSGSTIVFPTTSTPTTGATATSDSSATESANILPTSSNSAALSYPIQTGLLGLFSLLGLALA